MNYFFTSTNNRYLSHQAMADCARASLVNRSQIGAPTLKNLCENKIADGGAPRSGRLTGTSLEIVITQTIV